MEGSLPGAIALTIVVKGFRCLNCPSKPEFPDMVGLQTHWNQTHTVPMTNTIELPKEIAGFFPEISSKSVKLYEEIIA